MKGYRLLLVVVIAFVVVVSLGYFLLFERGWLDDQGGMGIPRAPGGVAVKPVKEEQSISELVLSLVRLEGRVEIKRKDGPWRLAEIGSVLGPNDHIRTDASARAWLSMPDGFSIEVDVGSEFGIRTLAENVARFLLQEGMISADVMDDANRTFEVKAATTVARTKDARFQMITNRNGTVALGTSRGSVDVESAGKTITVSEGFRTRILKGRQPQDPIKIPSGLFLKVRWPEKRELSSSIMEIAGRTKPGARVRVNSMLVLVDANGKFVKKVRLNEGVNYIKVESYDVGGARKTLRSPRLKLDTKPDAFQIKTSPEMWEKNRKKTTTGNDPGKL